MALLEHNTFVKNDLLPSWWANAIQKFLSTGAPSFQITKQDATHIQITAAAGDGAAVIAIAGKWRWIEATISRAHPGGAAGTWDIYVVAVANKIAGGGIDETSYAYELRILESGKTPTVEAGVVDIFRKVGSLEWSGTQITRVDQTVNSIPTHAHRHATGQPDAIAPADISAATAAQMTAVQAAFGDPWPGGTASGVTASGWNFTATINAGTGVIGSVGTTGGRATVESTPTNNAQATLAGLVPPALPVAGKFMCIGVQLAANGYGEPATVSIVSGAEKATEAEAIGFAAAPAFVAKCIRIKDIMIKNVGGVFSIVGERDRRKRPQGFRWNDVAVTGTSITTTAFVPLFPQFRAEMSFQFVVNCQVQVESETAGDVLTLQITNGPARKFTIPTAAKAFTVHYAASVPVANASELLKMEASINVEGVGHKFSLAASGFLEVWEPQGPRNNGTT